MNTVASMSGAPSGASASAMPPARGDLSVLFAPRSIAFIGASERANAPASRGLRHCLRLGFSGGLYAVNPRHALAHATLFDAPCLPSVAALPAPVDVAVIALPAEATLEAVAQCARAGVKAAVICSSGWGESGAEGARREEALRTLLAASPMRVLGPNCIGVGAAAARYCVAYNSSFEHIAFRHRRPIGVVCQSGAMLGGLLLNGEDAGVGVEAFVHVGNGLDVSLEQAAAHLIERGEIATLALMIEGLSDGRAFVALARRARALGKHIAVFKAGVSAAGSQAVRSHTGALTGSDAVFDAVCREEAVVRVEEAEDLLPVARMLGRMPRPCGRRVLVYSLSGGGASVLADELTREGLELPRLGEQTSERCAALGNTFIQASNPFDVGGSVFSGTDAARAALEIAAADENVDAVAWIGVGAPRDERSNELLGAALGVLAQCGKPAVILSMSGTPVEAGFAPAHERNIPVARSARAAARLIAAALGAAPPAAADAPSVAALQASAFPSPRLVNENEAKAQLLAAGFPVLMPRFVADAAALAGAARAMGFPLVLKGIARGVAHKTEAGLVALRLQSEEAVLAAATAMRFANPQLQFEGYTLEPMLEDGVETVIGVRVDAQFGPMLMFGLGGITVELLRDVTFTQCPCTPARARTLIERTLAGRLLQGFRGRPAADIEALVDALVRLSEYAAERAGSILEIEINPFVVLPRGQGAKAVDALIILKS